MAAYQLPRNVGGFAGPQNLPTFLQYLRTQPWFPDLTQLLTAAPRPILLRKELENRTMLINMGPPCVDLLARVLNTICEARAPSMRCLYAIKWSVFSSRCSAWNQDPALCEVSLVLLLKEQRRCTPSTLQIFVAAIVAFLALVAGQCLEKVTLGERGGSTTCPHIVPSRDLEGPQTLQMAAIQAVTIGRIETTLA